MTNPKTERSGARKLVGLERSYSCSGCGSEQRSWTRMSACPDCGERFAVAVIHRAAVVAQSA
ncbi:MAG: hypothetical protein ACR2OC_07555 [Solirubrobacterales bacterium]